MENAIICRYSKATTIRLLVSHHPPASPGVSRTLNLIMTSSRALTSLFTEVPRAMVFLSATVVHGSGGRVLLPWEIVQCHAETITIRAFFITILLSRLGLSEFGRQPEVKDSEQFSVCCSHRP